MAVHPEAATQSVPKAPTWRRRQFPDSQSVAAGVGWGRDALGALIPAGEEELITELKTNTVLGTEAPAFSFPQRGGAWPLLPASLHPFPPAPPACSANASCAPESRSVAGGRDGNGLISRTAGGCLHPLVPCGCSSPRVWAPVLRCDRLPCVQRE